MIKLRPKLVTASEVAIEIKKELIDFECATGLIQPKPKLSLNPNPPVLNQSLTITFDGTYYTAFAEHGATVYKAFLQIQKPDKTSLTLTKTSPFTFTITIDQKGKWTITGWLMDTFGNVSAKTEITFEV